MAMINIEDNSGDWKRNLRSACIRALYGKPQEREPACQEVGYYYMCCVPSSLYKYYDDKGHRIFPYNALKVNYYCRNIVVPICRRFPERTPCICLSIK